MKNSDSNSDGENKTNESDFGDESSPAEPPKIGVMTGDSVHGNTGEEGNGYEAMAGVSSSDGDASKKGESSSSSVSDWKSSVSSLTQSSGLDSSTDRDSHHAAAAAVVANLHSIATQHSASANRNEGKRHKWSRHDDWDVDGESLTMINFCNFFTDQKPAAKGTVQSFESLPTFTGKRSAPESEDQDSGGYNSEADGTPAVSCSATSNGSLKAARNVAVTRSKRPVPTQVFPNANIESVAASDAATVQQGRTRKRAKKLDDNKREERNAREKERSFRISKQINELRNLLSSGGVIVPKGTKSSVLTEAANYIRMLQQHQYRSEM
jgi:hypothetical protein